MIGDEPLGLRRRDIQKVRQRELKQLGADRTGGRRWLIGAAVVVLFCAGLFALYALLRI